jgi:hypothetical protein
MPDFTLGAVSGNCWPESIGQNLISKQQLKVYPNPAKSVLYVDTKSKENRELYNYIGQQVYITSGNKIEVGRFTRGLYFVKVGSEVVKVILE